MVTSLLVMIVMAQEPATAAAGAPIVASSAEMETAARTMATPSPRLTHDEPPEGRFIPAKIIVPAALTLVGLTGLLGAGTLKLGMLSLLGGFWLRERDEGRSMIASGYPLLGRWSELVIAGGAVLVGVTSLVALLGYAALGSASAAEEEAFTESE